MELSSISTVLSIIPYQHVHSEILAVTYKNYSETTKLMINGLRRIKDNGRGKRKLRNMIRSINFNRKYSTNNSLKLDIVFRGCSGGNITALSMLWRQIYLW